MATAIALVGLFSFFVGGCSAVDHFTMVSALMTIGGLLLVLLSTRIWEYEEII